MTKRPRSPRKQSAEEQSPTNRKTMELSAWVPDPMPLAQLAGQLLGSGTATTPRRALQQAWVFFANSVALCAELRQASPQKLRERYGDAPKIVHSGITSRMIGQSGPPPKTLRFYPHSQHTDEVREYFGVQKARTIVDNIKEYCLNHQEEDNGCPYDGILKESEGVQGGAKYHDLPVEFLAKIKDFKHEKKVAGGRRENSPGHRKPLRQVVPDPEGTAHEAPAFKRLRLTEQVGGWRDRVMKQHPQSASHPNPR